MGSKKEYFVYLSIITMMFTLSCSSTKMHSVWKDKTFDGYINSIMVIAVAERPEYRKFFEAEFVKQFKKEGTEAIASGDKIPSEKAYDENVVLNEARNQGAQMILITSLVSIDETTSYHSQSRPSTFSKDYERTYLYVNSQSQTAQSVNLSSKIYETKTEKLIWSANSQTMDHQSAYNIIQSKVKAVVKNLRRNKLIR